MSNIKKCNVGQASRLSTLTNISTASLEKFINILKINEYIIQKIIELRDELRGFKEAKDLLQLSELTNLEWEEWKEEVITITVD